MKNLIAICCLLVSMFLISGGTAFAQTLNVDSLVQRIAAEKDDSKKVESIANIYRPEINNNPGWVIEIGLKLLKQSQADHNSVEASSAYSFLGHGYRLLGNNIKGLEYHHKAIVLAEGTGNFSLLSIAENQIGHIYKDREEYDKAIQFYQSSLQNAEKGTIERIKAWPMGNLASVYLSMDKLDSSLKYAQKGYEIDMKFESRELIFSFWNLGGVQSKLGNAPLAISYYNMALKALQGTSYVRYMVITYTGIAEHYQRMNQADSAELYARKAIAEVTNTPFFYYSARPAQLLTAMYEKTNCDSTLKYAKVLKIANDSLSSTKANQQIQLMTLEEDLRQQEVMAEKLAVQKQRKQNIQYALIGLGIIVLFILYLSLSHSFITNTKLIKFFGVIALLIVFEFLNLLLHPVLDRITHHSPVLMLLALVCIAALLVPLHHKLEKWATTKLVEKNKQVRLAAARKTIERLEKDNL